MAQVQYLQKAVDALVLCRQSLMNTYAFAFFLEKNNQAAIFEDNQADLETATEQLSGKSSSTILDSYSKFLSFLFIDSYPKDNLEKNNESAIFEENQIDLETATEKLSGD